MQISFDYIDILFGVIILVTTIRCIMKGFVAEALSMAAVILGILIAVIFAGQAAKLIDKLIAPSPWNQLAAFLILFLLVYLVIKIIQNALHTVFEKLHLDKLDKALGLFLGLVEGVLLVAVLLFAMNWLDAMFNFNLTLLTRKSFFAGLLAPLIIPVTEAFSR